MLSWDARLGERMLERVYAFLGRFISYPTEHARLAHALWCVHAHLMDRWESTPRLAFLSAEPGSGKTRALEVTELLVPNPIATVNVTPAYLFRKVGGEDSVTLLYDEIDTVFGPKARENEELRGLLNAGHRRGATAGRCAVRGKNIEPEEIPAYAAVAMAGIGSLPDTILSRSVIIRMRRRHGGEKVESFRRRIHETDGWRLRDSIIAWAPSATIEWPTLPDEIQDRDADVWEPLIAIADAIGGDWPERSRVAAIALLGEGREAEASLGIRLLADLRTIFADDHELPSKTILSRLIDLEEAPWGDLHGKPIDERGLARKLKAYGVKSKTIRIGASTPKGYSRTDLEDQWRRYLPSPSDKCATSETTPPVADVAHVLDFPKDEAITHLRKCEHCQRHGDTMQVVYGAAEAWLHRECFNAWRVAYDQLDIHSQPFYREAKP
jgi:uncharacterized protein DUF3631